MIAAGGITGCIFGAQCSDRVGRRATLLAAGVICMIGWILIFIAQYTGTPSAFKMTLLCGRILTGVCSGAIGITAPVSYKEYIEALHSPSKCLSCSKKETVLILYSIYYNYRPLPSLCNVKQI